MKKYRVCLLALVLVLLLVGCGHKHEWLPATCTEPEHCATCDETQGEPLGHTLTEANYQDASTCTVCGETVGEPLQAGFPAHNLSINMEEGAPMPYYTCCEDESLKTVGQATALYYKVFDSDTSYEAKDGYEWRTAQIQIDFADENAMLSMPLFSRVHEDWYNIELHDDTESVDGNEHTYQINWHGETYEVYSKLSYSGVQLPEGDWLVDIYYDYQVPVGYDGVVVGLRDPSVEWPEGAYIYDVADENTLFFRMK